MDWNLFELWYKEIRWGFQIAFSFILSLQLFDFYSYVSWLKFKRKREKNRRKKSKKSSRENFFTFSILNKVFKFQKYLSTNKKSSKIIVDDDKPCILLGHYIENLPMTGISILSIFKSWYVSRGLKTHSTFFIFHRIKIRTFENYEKNTYF